MKPGDLLATCEVLFVTVWSKAACWIWKMDEIGIFTGEKCGETIQVLVAGRIGWVIKKNVRIVVQDS